MSAAAPKAAEGCRLELTLMALAKKCPAQIDEATWLQALADGEHFLAEWGSAWLDGPRSVRLGAHTRYATPLLSAAGSL
jgi:hypothetical protein